MTDGKYVVDISNYANTGDDWATVVYRGDNPKEALFAWVLCEYCAPERVSVLTMKKAHAQELLESARSNMGWLKGLCSQEGFPYEWDGVEADISATVSDGCSSFCESQYLELVYPFSAAL